MKRKIRSVLIWIFTRTRMFDYIIMRLPGYFYKEVLTARICRTLGLSKITWQKMAEALYQIVPVVRACGVSLEELQEAFKTYSGHSEN